MAHALKRLFVLRVHLDVAEEREVVAGLRTDARCARRYAASDGVGPAAPRRASAFCAVGEQLHPPGLRRTASPRAASPFFSYALRQRLVAILLASTSGWLNGLMPRIEPATAVAISQRKNSSARSSLSATAIAHDRMARLLEGATAASCAGRRARLFQPQIGEEPIVAVHAGAPSGSPIDRDDALAFLAGRFGDELLEPGAEARECRRRDERQLVAARLRERTPRIVPSTTPGFSSGGTPGSHGVHHERGCVEEAARRRAPITAAGTRPKFDSAENRPPMLGTPTKMCRKRVGLARSVSSFEPGSVIATKCGCRPRRRRPPASPARRSTA